MRYMQTYRSGVFGIICKSNGVISMTAILRMNLVRSGSPPSEKEARQGDVNHQQYLLNHFCLSISFILHNGA